MNVLITGAAGYVGSALLDVLAGHAEIAKLIGVDLKPCPERHLGLAKLDWVQGDLADSEWRAAAAGEGVDVVVHCAYQIRQPYGAQQRARQRRSNVEGARQVFEFALNERSVDRLIHFSTVAIYGALPGNSLSRVFTEDSPLAEEGYLYGLQKREIETLLRDLHAASDGSTDVVILRPGSITGPYGRFGLSRYGLVSTLTGWFPFLPYGRSDWCRQYLHEDDVVDIVTLLVQAPLARGAVHTFNAAPNDYLGVDGFARVLGKRAIRIPPFVIAGLFGLFWHATRGAIATPKGAWRFLSYPIVVDGSRLTSELGYRYRYGSADALAAERGRFIDRRRAAEDPAGIGQAA